MKTLLTTLSICAALVLLPSAAFAVPGIRNSDHDLSNSSTTGAKNSLVTANQICIYCHTPHKAQSTQFAWNHSQTANTPTWGLDLDGQALGKTNTGTLLPTTLRSGSKRCLGCHDGSVAIGDVSNAGDGSAGIIAGLTSISTPAIPGPVVAVTDAAGKMIDASHTIGVGGAMGGNHPISIPYAGETGYNGANSSVKAANMNVVGGFYGVTLATCLSTTGVCTNAPVADGANGTLINLIPNTAGGTTNVGVECVSCHEPHNKYDNGWFTRVSVENASGLCRSCHNK